MTSCMGRALSIFWIWYLVACAPKPQLKPEMMAMRSLAEFADAERQPTALVQVAYLYTEAERTALNAKNRAQVNSEDWAALKPYVVFVHKSIEDGLPMPLEVLSKTVKNEEKRTRLKAMRSVLLVRYLGPTQGDGAHITDFLRFSRLAAGAPAFLLDLSTRSLFEMKAFDERLAAEDVLLSEQILPGIERAEDGTITFYTRGMAKYGLPDLEQSSVHPKDAKATFTRFQETISLALDQIQLRIGDTLNGYRLKSCVRSETAIERTCLNLGSFDANGSEN